MISFPYIKAVVGLNTAVLISTSWNAASWAHMLRNCVHSSILTHCGSPVYMSDEHKTIASQAASVVTFGINFAAKKRVAASTMCNTGRPSRYIMSKYASALNRTFPCPNVTRKRRGVFRIGWQGSHRVTMSSNNLCVDKSTASRPAVFNKLYNISKEG